MKKISAIFSTMLLATLCTQLYAQSQEDMQKWQAYMTPGEVHQMLAKSDGEWNEEISMYMSPGAPPQKMTASCVNKMIMGGRYQQSNHTGSFNGMPFEGQSIVGYDNITKKVISTWVDNMGTGIMYMEGTYDPATKTVTFTGKSTDPMAGKEVDVKETFQLVDDNTQMMTMYMVQDGKETKTMEIKFTRK